ncbi:MAG: ADP-ribosylglycohydrolase family protein [Desulfurivibrio sp.]|nr:ADP-ribosylglycohydrolase family protein [Desulfurivibrio sp.]
MLGAIAGDIIGSVYEGRPLKSTDFPLFASHCRFTDDTVLTVAVAAAILGGRSYQETVREFGRRYPAAGYGGSFQNWLASAEPRPYHSWGNGAAMRVSPVGFAFDSEAEVLAQARRSAAITHDHPEGIKGAQATALAVWLARQGYERQALGERLSRQFGYDLDRRLADIRPTYRFDVSCQGSVPEAIIAFLESSSYETAVRNAVSLGGDSDTQACIAGGIAEAFYGGVPAEIAAQARQHLPADLWAVCREFQQRFR